MLFLLHIFFFLESDTFLFPEMDMIGLTKNSRDSWRCWDGFFFFKRWIVKPTLENRVYFETIVPYLDILLFSGFSLSSGWWCCSVTQLCSTLCDPMNCSPPGSSVHGILRARILEWVAMPSSRASSRPRDQTHVSCIGRRVLYHWAVREDILFGYP